MEGPLIIVTRKKRGETVHNLLVGFDDNTTFEVFMFSESDSDATCGCNET